MNMLMLIGQALLGLGVVLWGLSRMGVIQFLGSLFGKPQGGSFVRRGQGILALLSGAMMWVAIVEPFFVLFASLLMIFVMVWAFMQHRLNHASDGNAGLLALGVGAVVAIVAQPLGVRVLALPSPDKLPINLTASAQVVKAYEPGLWFESVKTAPDGTIYLAGNSGENYLTGDKSQAQAKVIARSPDGSERIVFELPKGSTAGVIALDAEGQMYMTGQGKQLGVWRFTSKGQATLLARLPEGSWPNGLTVGPDGLLYVADSLMGAIWRVNPASGAVERVIDDKC